MNRFVELIDPRGRMSKRAYTRFVIRLVAAAAACLCLVILAGAAGLRGLAIALAGVLGLLLVANLMPTVRRLHDRGRSGWWLAIYLGFLALSAVPIEKEVDRHPLMVTVYALISFGFSVWFAIETLGRRGIDGPNRFGPEPSLEAVSTIVDRG